MNEVINYSSVERGRLCGVQVLQDSRGRLCVLESGIQVPFPIARVYFISGVPAGARRGGHAHRRTDEFLVAVAGSFRVRLNDGSRVCEYCLDSGSEGLFARSMTWLDLDQFTEDAVCLVLASRHFDEADYVRDFAAYEALLQIPAE